MALLKRSETTKPLRVRSNLPPSGSVSAARPQSVKKASPCQTSCLAGTRIRGVLALLAQREKLGLSLEEACNRAWHMIVETNPFPATTGRICPHRCEDGCSRNQKDGAVAVGAVERFIGDWGLEHDLPLPASLRAPQGRDQELSPVRPVHTEKIAIIGAGPAGLSCAYQLARRGYRTMIFESMPEPGGMLRYGIPRYRLPARVFEAEIQRILDLGVELTTGVRIGRDLSLEELRQEYSAVFVAPGAAASRPVEIPGARGPGVLRAVDFLREVARGNPPELGRHVVVAGGGNTAIDAARVSARLLGSEGVITLLRYENPAVDEELQDAIDEGVRVELRTTLSSVLHEGGGVDSEGAVERIVAQRIELGPKDSRGYPTLVPVAGGSYELLADSVILALGQQPDVQGLVQGHDGYLEADDSGKTRTPGVWRGGDAVAPSFAAVVIAQGRQAALSIDADLRGKPLTPPTRLPDFSPSRLKLECYEPRPRLERRLKPVSDRFADPHGEIDRGIGAEQACTEASRCLSCGSCFGCERCWMFCTPGCMKRLPVVAPGAYFTIRQETCDGCRKCAEECPCGFLDMT